MAIRHLKYGYSELRCAVSYTYSKIKYKKEKIIHLIDKIFKILGTR